MKAVSYNLRNRGHRDPVPRSPRRALPGINHDSYNSWSKIILLSHALCKSEIVINLSQLDQSYTF